MIRGQKHTGETLNATVSQNPNTGAFVFSFDNPVDMQVNLTNSYGLTINESSNNDQFLLGNSSGDIINGGNGNDIFTISSTAGGLNGNTIHGGTAIDFVTLTGSNTAVDLTQGAATGIEAVVGKKGLTGESVTVSLSQIATSALTDANGGKAFAAVIGSSGHVNVQEIGSFKLVGVVDAANHGFTATGAAITGDALTSLLNSVTSISSIKGNLASMFNGTATVPAHETHVADLNAYVFSNGTSTYTIWTDGVVTPTDPKGNVLSDVYQPTAVAPATPATYDAVSTLDKTDWGAATISNDVNGDPVLRMNDGSTTAYSAIVLKAGVSGVIIHGDAGANGTNWFGLGLSGGGNHIFGSAGGSIFDLQTSTSLQDYLIGGAAGFNIVRATADGADVDLTANNAFTAKAATGIDAVIGGPNLAYLQTVELDVGKVAYSLDATGAKVGVFEAMLGSSGDVLTLSGTGKWVEVATFAPGAALPQHASALVDASVLDAQFGSLQHTAENSLTGHLFEQVNNQGTVLKYLTVYTDATVVDTLAKPANFASLFD
jgi:hypothetical protein